MTKRSPACISAEPVAPSISTLPSARSTQLRPGCGVAAARRSRAARTRRRLARMLARIGSRKVTARTTPSPPRCAPSPPEPRRIANASSRTGSRVSRISGIGQAAVGHVGLDRARSRHGRAPRPSRRRSSHNIGGASLPKVKLFIVPWLGASRPVAANKASVTTWLVSTLPATTAAGIARVEHRAFGNDQRDRPQAAVVHRDRVVDQGPHDIERGGAARSNKAR